MYRYIYICVCVFVCVFTYTYTYIGFPGGICGKEPTTNAGDVGDLGLISELEMATHSNFFAGESYGQRSLAGYSS